MSTVSGRPECPSASLESIGSSPMVSQVEDGEEVAGPSLNKGKECRNLHALADLREQSSKGKGVLKCPCKTDCSSQGRPRGKNRVVSQNKMRRATGSATMPARLILRTSPPPPSSAMPARLILRSSPPAPSSSSAMPARLILRSSPPAPSPPPQSINPLVVNLTRPRSRPRAPSPHTTPSKRFAAPSTSTISRYNQFPAPPASLLKTFFSPSNPPTPYTPLSEQPLTSAQPQPPQAPSPPTMLGFEQFSIAPRFNLFSEQPSTPPLPPQAPSTSLRFGPFSAPGPQAPRFNPFLEQPLTPNPLPHAPSTLPSFSFGPFPFTSPPTSRSNPFMVQSTSQPQPQLPSSAHAMSNNWSRPNVVSTELGLAVGNQRVQRWPEAWRGQRVGPSNAEWMEFVEGLQFDVAGVGRRDPRPMSDEELKLKL